MNRVTLFIIAVVCVMGAMSQEPVATTQKVSYGTLESFPQFQSQYIESRGVTVWLPDHYVKGEPCDVLYMHDGQMLFDATSTWNNQEWKVDEVIGHLIAEGKIRRCIVVGLDNTKNRLNDYFPTQCYRYVPEEKRQGVNVDDAKGDQYLQFLVKEVKPFIDARYKPLTGREHTFVMGSSMGGLISLYALCEYPQVFGGAVCMSTHLSMNFFNPSFDNESWAAGFRKYVEEKLPAANTCLLYMDRGDVELDGTYAPYQDMMDAMLWGKGWDENHFMSLVFKGHKHMETFWAERLDKPYMFLLKK